MQKKHKKCKKVLGAVKWHALRAFLHFRKSISNGRSPYFFTKKRENKVALFLKNANIAPKHGSKKKFQKKNPRPKSPGERFFGVIASPIKWFWKKSAKM